MALLKNAQQWREFYLENKIDSKPQSHADIKELDYLLSLDREEANYFSPQCLFVCVRVQKYSPAPSVHLSHIAVKGFIQSLFIVIAEAHL